MTLTNLTLEATIKTNGKTFPGWESVEIWREFGNPVGQLRFAWSPPEWVGEQPHSA
jgi:prophage tail gpP-like protein